MLLHCLVILWVFGPLSMTGVVCSPTDEFVDSGHLVWTTIIQTSRSKCIYIKKKNLLTLH